jgi:hypothetical protein
MIPDSALFSRRLFRRVQPLIEDAAHKHRADRYRKKFLATTHLWMLVLHMASGSASLRQTHARLGANTQIRRRLGLEQWISLSQLARSSTSRKPACLVELIEMLTKKIKAAPSLLNTCNDEEWKHLNKVKAVDSTFVRLSGTLSPWSVHGGYEAGAKVQCGLDLATQIPQVLCMTTAQTSDQTALWEQVVEKDLSAWKGWTLIVDLGYYAHRHFSRLMSGGVHFVSKLHSQAAYNVVENRAVSQKKGWTASKDDEVLSDKVIVLGSSHNRKGAVIEGVRLITSCNPTGTQFQFITSRHDLEGWEVVELYRRRWDIELFFRWLKRHLGAVRPLGYSREAVWLTVLVGALVALLWLLLDSLQPPPPGMSRISWLRAVAHALPAVINLCLSG